jgi:hypothetical protein
VPQLRPGPAERRGADRGTRADLLAQLLRPDGQELHFPRPRRRRQHAPASDRQFRQPADETNRRHAQQRGANGTGAAQDSSVDRQRGALPGHLRGPGHRDGARPDRRAIGPRT